jgi:predicted DNA-binding transcriptional regulator YafY
MPRKKETITLSVPPGTKDQLEAIAARLGILWGSKPSSSGLITKIAQQELAVNPPFTLDNLQVAALRQAVKDLIDTGHIQEAESVSTLLLDHGNLETPLQQALMRQVSQPLEQWRPRIDQLIAQKQPFRIVYGNSQGELFEYVVRYAEIQFWEKRQYIQVWCSETADSQDIPELQHNRCLRLDRIQSIFPIQETWRGHFDSIDVMFHLKSWLIKAYESKPNDIDDQVLAHYRQVTRRIINPFWFYREIFRYGEDCELIMPEPLRIAFSKKVQALAETYKNH